MITIYSLLDPTTNELRYIGQTDNITRRYRVHCSAPSNCYRDNWIRSLAPNKPELLILEEVSEENADDAEIFWIAYFKSLGSRLTNLTEGGGGIRGYSYSSESKERMRNSWVNNPNRDNSLRSKEYTIITPDGLSFDIKNLTAYCRANDLCPSSMVAVAKGRVKHHKQYRCNYK